MENEQAKKNEYTIAEAAKLLGVTEKTIRNRIEANKLEFYIIDGKFGKEYRVINLKPVEESGGSSYRTQEEAQENTNAIIPSLYRPLLDQVERLTKENQKLAMELGASLEREKQLNQKVLMLEAPQQNKKKWWEFWK